MIAVAVYGIDWDTEDVEVAKLPDPPPENVEYLEVDADDGFSLSQIADVISEALSDEYGFLVNGFESWERVKLNA